MRIERFLEQLPAICCFITGLILIARLSSGPRLLVLHALLGAFTEIFARLMLPGNNHFVYTIFLPVDFFLVLYASREYLGRSFPIFMIPATLVFLGSYSYILLTEGTEFLPFGAIVTSWILQAVCWFLVMQRSLKQVTAVNLKGICLIAGGIMLFTCTTAPIWAMFRYNMLNDPGLARNLQELTGITSMIRYVACAIGFTLLADKRIPVARHAVR